MLQNTCRREFGDSGACVDMVAIGTTNERMDRATLPSIPWIRTLDNEVIGDILYYFSTYHGHEMLSLVINKLNSAYTNFISEHPEFNGPISLIAHSLGGLVCYEILYYKRLLEEARTRNIDVGELVNPRERERYRDLPELLFTPNRLFSMGSPLGGTLVFRNLSFSDYLIPASVGYHNIFHPYDPFGYRTEPLVDDYYEDTPAVPITTDMVPGSAANSVSRFGNKRMTLGGSMADLGKTFVDAMTTAPATFSSTVMRAAKTSVSLPINAIMNTGRRDSLQNEQTLHRRKLSLFGSSTTVFSSKDSEHDSERSKRRHSLSKLLPGLKSFTFKSHRSSKSSSSVAVTDLAIASGSRRQSVIAEEPSAVTEEGGSSTPESSLSFSCTSQMATINAMVSVSPDAAQESSTSVVSAHISPVTPPHHSTTPSSATATSSPLSGVDEDDLMLSHIMRIFKVSRAPTREQQIAEAQGLPLSSRLVAGQRVGTRASTTTPNGYAQPSRPVHSAHAHSGATGAESGSAVDLKSSATESEEPKLRRYSTMPPVLPLLDYVPTAPATEATDEEESPAAAASEAEEEPPSTNTKLAHRLPYTERMDYIIPFSKGHLQNEYWLGFQAHFSYWTSKDVVYHILYHMVHKPINIVS
ncbi:hypothetical protein IW146_002608 [Coemansia sp. RSA 922]|nr:hypothetical protein IW146_002608 [Coemansia sp. RSA 922]